MNKKKNIKEDLSYKDILSSTLEYCLEQDLDDTELKKIRKFKNLEVYEQNLIIMRSQGRSLRDIGAELNVSYQWVYQHLKQVYKKLE